MIMYVCRSGPLISAVSTATLNDGAFNQWIIFFRLYYSCSSLTYPHSLAYSLLAIRLLESTVYCPCFYEVCKSCLYHCSQFLRICIYSLFLLALFGMVQRDLLKAVVDRCTSWASLANSLLNECSAGEWFHILFWNLMSDQMITNSTF